jgi:uncharacterized sulfatase
VPVIGYDLLPTFTEVAGAMTNDVDGVSFVSTFDNSEGRSDRNLIWHFPYYHPEKGFAKAQNEIGVDDFAISRTRPQSAIRRGNYKLLRFDEHDRIELYDLSTDIAEQNDLSEELPKVATDLSRILTGQLAEMNARFAVSTP